MSRATSIKHIHTGHVVTFDIDTVLLPNGQTIDLDMIRHPGASAIVPVHEDGSVTLIRQFRHAAGGFIYEIPAGKLNPGEDPQDCAARELEEEIGYRAGQLDLLTSIFTAPGFTDEVIHIYKGSALVKGTQNLDHDEVIEVLTISLAQALDWIRTGIIRDAKTMVGLHSVYLATLR